MDKVNVCFISRNRIERLADAIKFVEANTSNYHLSLIFDDDKESYEHFTVLGYDCYLYTPRQECVKMTNHCYEITKKLGLDYFAFLNDDMETQEGWLEAAMKDFNDTFKDGEGVISFNLMPGGERLACAGLTTVKFVDNTLEGVFFNETFIHNEGDSEFSYRAIKYKKFKWCEESHVNHNHYHRNPKLIDSTYTESSHHYPGDLLKRKEMIGDGVYREPKSE